METCSTVASLGMCQRDNVKAMCRKSCKLCITTESTNEEVKEDENRKQEDTKGTLHYMTIYLQLEYGNGIIPSYFILEGMYSPRL